MKNYSNAKKQKSFLFFTNPIGTQKTEKQVKTEKEVKTEKSENRERSENRKK